MTNKIEKVYVSFDDWRYSESIDPCITSARDVWNARQPEIEQLKERIRELESDNEALRHILRNNV